MSNSFFAGAAFKDSDKKKPKPTITIRRIYPIYNVNSNDDLSDQIKALQKSVARLTYLVTKSLEERHYRECYY